MKYSLRTALLSLLLCLMLIGCGGGDNNTGGGNNTTDPELWMGILQFRAQHNLEDNTCLPDQCYLRLEEETDTATWLDELAAVSNMAVLHWDRSIPWLAFDVDPPTGTRRTDFYDTRIDVGMLNWINAFAAHFNRMSYGYLAVSILSGQRDRPQQFRVDETMNADVTGACPSMAPGTQISFQYDPGSGQVNATFDLERSYTNFVMYLYDKLHPDALALMVEVNSFKEATAACAANWDGLAQLYRNIYDTIRPQVDSRTKVFATVVFQPLLDYDSDTCHGPLAFESCVGTPSPPSYGVPDPDICYPLDLSAVNDLNQGDRLEVLALSIYPDAFLMDVGSDNLIRLYPETWDLVSDCTQRAQAVPFLDPVAALDRFGWTKPIAIAELGARSDRTLRFQGGYLLQLLGDLTSQAFWLDHWLKAAKARDFAFYVTSFCDDYPAIGPWTVHDNVLDRDTYSLFNNFAYMGIYDHQGLEKSGVTQTWLDALP